METLIEKINASGMFALSEQGGCETIFAGEFANKLLQFARIDKKLSNLILLRKFNYVYTVFGYSNIIFPFKINDIIRINKFLEQMNRVLPIGGKLFGYIKLKDAKKQEIYSRNGKLTGKLLYALHFLIHRVAPKLPYIKKVYFNLTKGKDRTLTKTEILGRFYACSFMVNNELVYKNHLFLEVKKIEIPQQNIKASYGPLIRLKRVGKCGKLFNVYKLRTMHPYSEFLQEYIYEKNSLQKGGKFNNDFRISTLGKLFRKYWIDELPMLINIIKGDMKLVGVRPLSQHYFALYTEEAKKLRTQFKPGLFPPYYADMPETLDEIMASEKKYLTQYMKKPVKTDIKYFFKVLYNILFRHKLSQ